MAHMAQVPPANLYHYTSLDVLLKILDSGRLWASNLRYLNDSSEYAHLLVAVDRRVKELLTTADAARAAHLAQLSIFLEKQMDRDVFAVCFSAKRDDLNQWRGYCPPGQGVCIGFSSAALRASIQMDKDTIMDRATSLLGPISYLGEDGGNFDNIIEKACEPPTQELTSSPVFVGLITAGTAQFYKHAAFREEQEWRISVGQTPRTGKVEGVRFRMGKSTLVPYVELDIRSQQPAFISEIVVGPSPNISLSVEAVRTLLYQHNLNDVLVDKSSVPYRHW
jgi:hypothetical protein